MFPTKWTYLVALLPSVLVIVYVIIMQQSRAYDPRDITDLKEIEKMRLMVDGRETIEQPIVHLVSLIAGTDDYLRVETLLKSVLLFHRGSLHYHFIADAGSREVLSALLQTWQIDNLRWSIYEARDAADRLGWIRSSRPEGFSQIELVLDDILPGYVDKVILLDIDVLMLEDVATVAEHFDDMEKRGVLIARSTNNTRPNKTAPAGISLYHLHNMRREAWREIWHTEAAKMATGIAANAPTEQEIFKALAASRSDIIFPLPISKETAIKTHPNLRHSAEDNFGRRIQRCIASLDGSVFESPLKNQTFDSPRTLEYITPQLASEGPDEVTLLLQAPVQRVAEEFESTAGWLGPITITTYGTDEERIALMDDVKEAKRNITMHYMYRTEKSASDPMEHMKKLSIDSSKTSNVLLIDQPDLIDYSKNLYTLVREQREMNASDIHIIQTADMHPIGAAMSKMIAQRVLAAGRGYLWAEEHLNVTTSIIVMSAIPEKTKLQRRDRIASEQRIRRQEGLKPASDWCQREIEMLLRKSSQSRR